MGYDCGLPFLKSLLLPLLLLDQPVDAGGFAVEKGGDGFLGVKVGKGL